MQDTPLPPYRRYAVSDEVRQRQAEIAADALQAGIDRAALPLDALDRALAELDARDREERPQAYRLSPRLANGFLVLLVPALGALVMLALGHELPAWLLPGMFLAGIALYGVMFAEMRARRPASSAGRDTMPLEPTGRSCGRCGERSPFEARHCIQCGSRLLQESNDAR